MNLKTKALSLSPCSACCSSVAHKVKVLLYPPAVAALHTLPLITELTNHPPQTLTGTNNEQQQRQTNKQHNNNNLY